MILTDFQEKKLPLLGFGAMRLPLIEGTSAIDEAHTEQMVDYAMAHGLNYFDTAYPYHGGLSEVVISRLLKKYPRESYYLADKYPGHQLASSYDPAAIFEDQLKKCDVTYFDFYLLHNVCELAMPAYTDPKWGIVDYFVEQKKLGRIRHLGFSTHAAAETMKAFLDQYGEHMEFCQIQLNYLDWTLQDAKAKCKLLTDRSIPIWVMEPVRGGKLAKLSDADMEKLGTLRSSATAAEWAFRWLQGVENVSVILSGMSNMDQLKENVQIFETPAPLTSEENAVLMTVAEGMKNSVPCTACRYCVDGCPMGLDIPALLAIDNELRFAPAMNIGMRIDAMPEAKRPSACIGCGACTQICPQHIDIPGELSNMVKLLAQSPSWAQICREREEAAKKLKG